MTDNRDWAAEIVMEILNQHGTDDHIHLDKLCEVLRKVDRAAELRGRVAGMRETIALLEKCGNGECLYHVEEIEAAATKLESSPTT